MNLQKCEACRKEQAVTVQLTPGPSGGLVPRALCKSCLQAYQPRPQLLLATRPVVDLQTRKAVA